MHELIRSDSFPKNSLKKAEIFDYGIIFCLNLVPKYPLSAFYFAPKTTSFYSTSQEAIKKDTDQSSHFSKT